MECLAQAEELTVWQRGHWFDVFRFASRTSFWADRYDIAFDRGFNLRWSFIAPEELSANMYGSGKESFSGQQQKFSGCFTISQIAERKVFLICLGRFFIGRPP